MKNRKIIFLIILILFISGANVIKTHAQAQVYTTSQWITMNSQTLNSLADYTENPTNMQFSKYGGWLEQQTTATGFFRVEKINGRWWAIDPEGYYYVHKALNSVNLNDFTADEIYQLLHDKGFNGLGNWSDEDILLSSLKEQTPLAYCPKISFIGTYRAQRNPRIEMPVFDDEFVAYANTLAQGFSQYVNDPHVFGYFSDNELPWRDDGLPAHLEITDTNDKNYIAAIDFLTARGKTASNWDEEDQNAYMALMAERYYSIVSAAINSVDSNHMYIGSRCHSSERFVEDFMINAGQYVDIFTTNHYSKWGSREFEIKNMANWSGRPLMMSEFYAMEYDPTISVDGAGIRVVDQASRGLFYQNYVSTLAQTGSVVGWHWFKFQDDESGNKGIVDELGNLHTTLLDDMQEMNTHIYDFIDYVDAKPEPIITLTPEADAYYKGDDNFNDEELISKYTTNTQFLRESYIRFDIPSLSNTISSAEIKLFSINTGLEISNYQAELVVDDSWDESIVYSNSPDGSTVLATWSAGGDIIFDVTNELLDAINQNNKLSIRVVSTLSNNNTTKFGSSEHSNPIAHPKLFIYSDDTLNTNTIDNQTISIHPNPVLDTLNINGLESVTTSFQVVNVLGATVFSSNISDSKSQIDMSFLKQGVYFLKINTTTGTVIKKIIKK